MDEIIETLLEANPNLINNTTIFYKKYPINVIEENLFKLNIHNILMTQDLNINFIIKYILLNPDIMFESFANIETICYFQKNISKIDLEDAIKLINEC
jgi:hypothetical protein